MSGLERMLLAVCLLAVIYLLLVRITYLRGEIARVKEINVKYERVRNECSERKKKVL